MSNPGFLFAGFALAWGLAFAYLWHLSRRARDMQRQIEALEERLRRTSPDA